MRCALLSVLACLLVGCASTVETVEHQLLLQPGTATYQMDELELFVMPLELETPLPAFPQAIEAAEVPPVTICAELWLSASGEVTRVAPVRDLPGCAGGDDVAGVFEQSVLDSLTRWTFVPARVCRFREDQREKRERGDCRGDVEIVSLPVRLAYAFRFERRQGRASVGSRRLPD